MAILARCSIARFAWDGGISGQTRRINCENCSGGDNWLRWFNSKLLEEAVNRGHFVTAITRSLQKPLQNERIRPGQADADDVLALTELFRGQDAFIHSCAPARN